MNERLDAYRLRQTHAATRSRRPDHTHREMRQIKASGKPCRQCGSPMGVECHHIVHRARMGSRHASIHHPNNGMPLCHDCHQAHHTHAEKRIPRRFLTQLEVEFALEHAGVGWLDRWYPNPEETP